MTLVGNPPNGAIKSLVFFLMFLFVCLCLEGPKNSCIHLEFLFELE